MSGRDDIAISFEQAGSLPAGPVREALMVAVSEAAWRAFGEAVRAGQEANEAVRNSRWAAAVDLYVRAGQLAADARAVVPVLEVETERYRSRRAQ